MTQVIEEDFTAHDNLLRDVMMRQAGTLTKALLEGVMNSVDAKDSKRKKPKCRIDIDPEGKWVSVTDNGKGFKSIEEIRRNFKVLGQPHDEIEKAQKTYGNFRMGRGQLFSFGANTWETNKFKLRVDLKNEGLKYQLEEVEKGKKGCRVTIQLYKPLLPSDIEQLKRDLRKAVEWVPIEVLLGDERISKDAAQAKWDYESDSCYLKLQKTGGLAIYNLGVLVCHKPGSYLGHGGILLSKKQLRLNFARNDVMEDECEVWKEAKKFARSQARKETTRRKSWTADERQRVVNDLINNDIDPTDDVNIDAAPIFTATNGRHYTANQLVNLEKKYPAWTVASRDSVIADKVMQHQRAFAIAQETLERFDVEHADEFVATILGTALASTLSQTLGKWSYEEFDSLCEDYKDGYVIVDEDVWTPAERVWVRQLQGVNGGLARLVGCTERKLLLGESDRAAAWTDGSTYIAFDRRMLARQNSFSIEGCHYVLSTMLHEYCHDEATNMDTVRHTPEFYEQFHNISQERSFSYKVLDLVNSYQKAAKRERKKLGKMALKVADKLRENELTCDAETTRMQELEEQLATTTSLAASCRKQ